MGLHVGAYAKVWAIKKPEGKNYYQMEMSISKKNADGEYQTDWSDRFVRAVGTAAKQVDSGKIKEGDRVQIGSCDVTNFYSKEKEKTYVTYTIFEFLEQKDEKKAKTSSTTSKKESTVEADVEELPFS